MNELENNGKKVFWTCGVKVCPVCMQPVSNNTGRWIGKDLYHHRCVSIAKEASLMLFIILMQAAIILYMLLKVIT